MLKTVYLLTNPLDFSEVESCETENVLEFLAKRFDKWPDTGRIYHEFVSDENDVTPSDESGIEKLASLEGNIFCVIYPADPITILYAIVAIAIVAVVLLAPKVPTVSERNTQQASPNNELSSRTNKPRPNGRIPDIFGQVRSTPDLIGAPYTTFEANQEVENCIMCIGRGQYEIHDVYDGETLWSDVPGSTVQIYKPFTAVNSESPYIRIGAPILEPTYNVARSNSVNGQVLRPPNSETFVGNSDVIFESPNRIKNTMGRDFTGAFSSGDVLTITNSNRNKGVNSLITDASVAGAATIRITPARPTITAGNSINLPNAIFFVREQTYAENGFDVINVLTFTYYLTGLYTIASVSSTGGYTDITLSNPELVNPQWSQFSEFGGSDTSRISIEIASAVSAYNVNGDYIVSAVSEDTILLSNPAAVNAAWAALPVEASIPGSPTLATSGPKWIGPFVMEDINGGYIFGNFVAANGLYKDNGDSQYPADVHVEIQGQQINPDGTVGPWVSNGGLVIKGSAVNKETRAATLKFNTPFVGKINVRARRVNPSDTEFTGNVVDEIKWKDLYRATELASDSFGNVTIIRSKSYATAGALALKERKLNTLVTRQLSKWNPDDGTFGPLTSTVLAYDIITHICLDQKIGNRQVSELDLYNIRNTIDQAYVYFGLSVDPVSFCYTFDKENLSFEETIQMVAGAVFCLAYRQGNLIRLSFERETEDSTLLFNHRNKLPGSETRTVSFGNQDDCDGIELEYVSPEDDAVITYYLPTDRSSVNPKKIETVGVRNFKQAYLQAWRAWNKVRYQNMQVEFDATHEADMSIPTDRILVADNTRPNTQDGEITAQNGLTVSTSQKLTFESGVSYTMFLQLYDGTVQAIEAVPGPNNRSATLSQAPRVALAVENDLFAQTTYILVGNNDVRQKAFLVTEKITQDNQTSKIRASNYDRRFYERDKDFVDNIA